MGTMTRSSCYDRLPDTHNPDLGQQRRLRQRPQRQLTVGGQDPPALGQNLPPEAGHLHGTVLDIKQLP